MFLKKLQRSVANPQASGGNAFTPIIAEAEFLLYQRMCNEGGWNYGNAQVLGEELRPYPLTTAVALIALQKASNPECQKSLGYLQRAVREERSALALCMVVHCFSLYGIPAEPWMQAATVLYGETQYFHNIKTSALALLALQSLKGRSPFRLAD
jgi:hypothetical protein